MFVRLDIAKRLLDFGYHPPTIYFPLNVEECMMIEPTETNQKKRLMHFIDAMIQIAKEAEENPEIVQEAPHTTVINRLDETTGSKKTNLTISKKNIDNRILKMRFSDCKVLSIVSFL